MAPAARGGLTVGVGATKGVLVAVGRGVAVGTGVGVWVGDNTVRVGDTVWAGDTVFAGVVARLGVDVGGTAEAVGIWFAGVVPDDIAARVPRTLASIVAWVSGAGLDTLMVGLSAADELSGDSVAWVGKQAVSNMPLISNVNPMVLDKNIRNQKA